MCAGGGITGAVYEIGCLRALENLLDRSALDFDLYVGVSGGAFVASLMIGIIQTFAVALDYSVGDLVGGLGFSVARTGLLSDLWPITVARVAPILPYLLLILVLIVRPTGLFGTRET